MNLRVERYIFSQDATIGKLFIDGEFAMFTLEPVWRTDDVKPRAIPEGTFRLIKRWSKEHNREVPGVEDVPGFTEVEIHWGNSPKDTKACLLVGRVFGPEKDDWISQSDDAFFDLMEKLVPVWDRGETIDITYVNKFSEAAA